MTKPKSPATLDRRLVARLASEGEPPVLLAELSGLPRLEIEAALHVDPELAELRRYYEQRAGEPALARRDRLRRLLVVAVERALEEGDLRGIGWAVRGLGLLDPAPDDGGGSREIKPPAPLEVANRDVEAFLDRLGPEARSEWDELGYQRWPVPPTIPWRPGVPRPRGPLAIENEAGTESERAAAPIPWPPPRPRRVGPDKAAPATDDRHGASEGSQEEASGSGSGRWPPHLRPV